MLHFDESLCLRMGTLNWLNFYCFRIPNVPPFHEGNGIQRHLYEGHPESQLGLSQGMGSLSQRP